MALLDTLGPGGAGFDLAFLQPLIAMELTVAELGWAAAGGAANVEAWKMILATAKQSNPVWAVNKAGRSGMARKLPIASASARSGQEHRRHCERSKMSPNLGHHHPSTRKTRHTAVLIPLHLARLLMAQREVHPDHRGRRRLR